MHIFSSQRLWTVPTSTLHYPKIFNLAVPFLLFFSFHFPLIHFFHLQRFHLIYRCVLLVQPPLLSPLTLAHYPSFFLWAGKNPHVIFSPSWTPCSRLRDSAVRIVLSVRSSWSKPQIFHCAEPKLHYFKLHHRPTVGCSRLIGIDKIMPGVLG